MHRAGGASPLTHPHTHTSLPFPFYPVAAADQLGRVEGDVSPCSSPLHLPLSSSQSPYFAPPQPLLINWGGWRVTCPPAAAPWASVPLPLLLSLPLSPLFSSTAAADQLGRVEGDVSPCSSPMRQSRKKEMMAYGDGSNRSVIQASLEISHREQDLVRGAGGGGGMGRQELVRRRGRVGVKHIERGKGPHTHAREGPGSSIS